MILRSASSAGTVLPPAVDKDLEEKYKKVMMSNAQLDDEKQTIRYQMELLKDQIGDMEEELLDLKRQQTITRRVSLLTEFSVNIILSPVNHFDIIF